MPVDIFASYIAARVGESCKRRSWEFGGFTTQAVAENRLSGVVRVSCGAKKWAFDCGFKEPPSDLQRLSLSSFLPTRVPLSLDFFCFLASPLLLPVATYKCLLEAVCFSEYPHFFLSLTLSRVFFLILSRSVRED